MDINQKINISRELKKNKNQNILLNYCRLINKKTVNKLNKRYNNVGRNKSKKISYRINWMLIVKDDFYKDENL